MLTSNRKSPITEGMGQLVDIDNSRLFSTTPDMAALLDGEAACSDASSDYRIGYRDAARRSLHLLNQVAWAVCGARNPRLAIWQVASALGLQVACDKSDVEIAAICGVKSRAAVSKGRLEFQRANNIKPMPGQKSERARKAYSAARKEQLNAN